MGKRPSFVVFIILVILLSAGAFMTSWGVGMLILEGL